MTSHVGRGLLLSCVLLGPACNRAESSVAAVDQGATVSTLAASDLSITNQGAEFTQGNGIANRSEALIPCFYTQSYRNKALFKFELNAIPARAKITRAALTLTFQT